MSLSNDNLSQRTKFVFIVWCGPQVKVMRKAKLSVHTADVKRVIHAYAIEMAASELDDLKEDDVLLSLRKAGGANYDRRHFQY